jgi:putative tryptophan/tyrosine transport system substrate-binding protein
VVFVVVSDPVGAGIVASLSRPGGNFTGLINVESSMSGKWVELLKEVAPGLRRAAIIFNPDTAPGHGTYFAQAFEDSARSFNLEPISAPVHTKSDIEEVISGLAIEPRGGLVMVTDSFMFVHRATVIEQTARHGVSAVYPNRVSTREGGLLSYGASNIDIFHRAASHVDRILRGVKPSELPVEVPTKFELAVNLKTAKALGLAVPPTLLARADEVIE